MVAVLVDEVEVRRGVADVGRPHVTFVTTTLRFGGGPIGGGGRGGTSATERKREGDGGNES